MSSSRQRGGDRRPVFPGRRARGIRHPGDGRGGATPGAAVRTRCAADGLGVQHQQHRPGHRRQLRRLAGGHVRPQAGVDGRGRRRSAASRLPRRSPAATSRCWPCVSAQASDLARRLPNLMAIAAEISRPEKAASTAAAHVLRHAVRWRAGGPHYPVASSRASTGARCFILGGVLPILLIPALRRLMPETLVRDLRESLAAYKPVAQRAFRRRARRADAAALARLSPDPADPLSIPELAADPGHRQGARQSRSRRTHRWHSTSAASRGPC